MTRFTKRALVFVSVSAVLLLAWMQHEQLQLGRPATISGWALLACVLFLAGYNRRKKKPHAPGSSRHWFLLHLIIGWFSLFLFCCHIGFRIPNGPLEQMLALVFVGICLSGVIGWRISRSFPKRLRERNVEVPFEAIPDMRVALLQEADACALDSIAHGSRAVLEQYDRYLRPFLLHKVSTWDQIFGRTHDRDTRLKQALQTSLGMSAPLQEQMGTLIRMIETKDTLDFHQAHQGLIKRWLFVHIPLSFLLLLLIFVHVVCIYAFGGEG